MWSKVFVIALTLASSLPLLCRAQQTPVKNFEQKQKKQMQQQEKKDLNTRVRQANTAFLNQRLANNTNLTDAQKTELIGFFESQYNGGVSLRNPRHTDAVNFFEQIANSPDMAQNEKKAAIKSYFEQNRPVTKAGAEQQRMEKNAEMNSIRSFEIRESIQQTNTER